MISNSTYFFNRGMRYQAAVTDGSSAGYNVKYMGYEVDGEGCGNFYRNAYGNQEGSGLGFPNKYAGDTDLNRRITFSWGNLC